MWLFLLRYPMICARKLNNLTDYSLKTLRVKALHGDGSANELTNQSNEAEV